MGEPLKIVALGASDVVGVGAGVPTSEGWAPVMASLLPGEKRLMRLGISGATAAKIRAELLPRAVKAAPDVAVAWVGVNDCAQQVPLPAFEADLDAIAGALAGTGARVFLVNLPELAKLPAIKPFAAWARTATPLWQEAVRRVAARHGARVVELAAYSAELDANPGLMAGDGFHPSTLGHRRVAEVVAQAIRDGG